jgi:hypothetical protein
MKWMLMLNPIKIQKNIRENGVKQHYKPTSKDEL